jgi:hypothetical protein
MTGVVMAATDSDVTAVTATVETSKIDISAPTPYSNWLLDKSNPNNNNQIKLDTDVGVTVSGVPTGQTWAVTAHGSNEGRLTEWFVVEGTGSYGSIKLLNPVMIYNNVGLPFESLAGTPTIASGNGNIVTTVPVYLQQEMNSGDDSSVSYRIDLTFTGVTP